MKNNKLETIYKFFEAYGKKDREGLAETLSADVRWVFPGHNPLSGLKTGIDELVEFFDRMGNIMEKSNIKVEKLVTGVHEDHVVECHRVITDREDGNNLDHEWCVLWTVKDGKITEGRHLAADQHAADTFFCKVLEFT